MSTIRIADSTNVRRKNSICSCGGVAPNSLAVVQLLLQRPPNTLVVQLMLQPPNTLVVQLMLHVESRFNLTEATVQPTSNSVQEGGGLTVWGYFSFQRAMIQPMSSHVQRGWFLCFPSAQPTSRAVERGITVAGVLAARVSGSRVSILRRTPEEEDWLVGVRYDGVLCRLGVIVVKVVVS